MCWKLNFEKVLCTHFLKRFHILNEVEVMAAAIIEVVAELAVVVVEVAAATTTAAAAMIESGGVVFVCLVLGKLH